MQRNTAAHDPCGLGTLHDMEDKKPSDAGLYALGGVAMFVSLVWVFSFWWV